ncbi:hypothetical protein ACTHQ4_14620 [Alkalicoccobacillus gibsonii]|uniref:hypothetical protein n=1 Tax=Alkalicoccobacillus gibsonii TaxID=79881 RepID=UPI003F7C614B
MNTRVGLLFTGFLMIVLVACGDNDQTDASNEENETSDETVVHEPSVEIEEDLEDTEESEAPESESEVEAEEHNSDVQELKRFDSSEEREAKTTKEDEYVENGLFVGGEITDGKVIDEMDHGLHDGFERLVLDVYEGNFQEVRGQAMIPNYFEVAQEYYPARLVYTLNGIRDQANEFPNFEESTLFSYMDILPVFDDSMMILASYFNESVEYEVFEMHEPRKIVTDVRMLEKEEHPSVFSVRTRSIFPAEETVEGIQRFLSDLDFTENEHVRTIHSKDETLFVEEGYYRTMEEAEARVAELQDDLDFELHIEERGMFDLPEVIE